MRQNLPAFRKVAENMRYDPLAMPRGPQRNKTAILAVSLRVADNPSHCGGHRYWVCPMRSQSIYKLLPKSSHANLRGDI